MSIWDEMERLWDSIPEEEFNEIVEVKLVDDPEVVANAIGHWMTVKEAANYIGVSEKTIRRLIARKKIRIMQPGLGNRQAGHFLRVSVIDLLMLNS